MNVVIIDGNEFVRQMYQRFFSILDCEIRTFSNFEAASEVLDNCDLLISANRFEKLTGFAAVLKLKTKKSSAKCPKSCAIISGDMSCVDLELAQHYQIDILTKPINFDELFVLVNKAKALSATSTAALEYTRKSST